MRIKLSSLFLCLFAFMHLNAQVNPSTNFISLDISTFPQNSAFTYDSCLKQGTDLGISSVGLSQAWTDVEISPGVFNMTIFDIANYYYPLHNMPIDLSINPIQTNRLEVPSDLTATDLNDPILESRFNNLLDSIKLHTPNLTLSSIIIGSEEDIYLGNDSVKWGQYWGLYHSAMSHARFLWPGIKVATELTFQGITTKVTLAQNMNFASDYIGVSYYPINTDFTVQAPTVVATDFNTICSLYPTRPICFYQFGYPTSTTCNSSETMQQQFIAETFNAWDAHATAIRMIDFTWLHDLDTAAVNYYGTYYGITNPTFLEFLRTLGFRNWGNNGSDKAGFTELKCQTKIRGFNNLSIPCTTGIPERGREELYISPNPARDNFSIANNVLLTRANLKIFNTTGQKVKDVPITASTSAEIDIHDLPDGIYYLILQNNNKQFTTKLIKQK